MLKLLAYAKIFTSISQSSAKRVLIRSLYFSPVLRKQVQPVSLDEFYRHYQGCLPRENCNDTLAVAFSGGPDSTCLLYLLKQLCDSDSIDHCKPKNILAITIDHDLQEASRSMAEKCVAIADSLRIQHLVLRISWGTAPFPPVPSKDSAFEKLAREARYHLLLSAMKDRCVSTIAFGHHADDQLETALLRITHGSTEVGAAGMRSRRLWGMGFGFGPDDLGWAGQHGMSRWIIRPLLRFPKDRLVATCDEAGLEYVVDKTNFLPDVALRNRIRYELGNSPSESISEGTKALLHMAGNVSSFDNGKGKPRSILQGSCPTSREQLRSAVESLSDFSERLNFEVSNQLAKCLHSSPVSTILLSKDAFSRVTDNSVRLGIIRRILRFVSPFPWGSASAEAGRRSASLQRISDTLIMSGEPRSMTEEAQMTAPLRRFVAGGGVVWSPVRITGKAGMKFSERRFPFTNNMGWLASRQPPIKRFRENVKWPLELDITSLVVPALSHDHSVEILYDCRFLLRITPRLFPPDVLKALTQLTTRSGEISADQRSVKLLVISYTRYFIPRVVLRRTDAQAEFSSSDGSNGSQGQGKPHKEEHEIARLLPDGSTRTQSTMGENNKDGECPASYGEAVRIKCIRILDEESTNEYLR